jgi:hypothetical protein
MNEHAKESRKEKSSRLEEGISLNAIYRFSRFLDILGQF